MNNEIKCLHCQAVMDAGFIVDITHGGVLQEQWSPGAPQKSFWTGLKYNRDAMVPVVTLRCPKCGYLESYANPPAV